MLALRRISRQSPSSLSSITRSHSSTSSPPSPSPHAPPQDSPEPGPNPPNTHFKVTLRRSPIALGARIKGTLASLGMFRRMQTVYFPHSPIVAGKILSVKELVEVENVPAHAVRTKEQQTKDRKPPRGYQVVGSRISSSDLP